MTIDSNDADDREEEIFHGARRQASPAAREAFLVEACHGDRDLRRQVEELLRADAAAAGFLAEATTLEGPGSTVGRYVLSERIGEGGCGEVFRARAVADDLPAVAVKIVKAGMDTKQVLARFELERRSLARMDHPGIARVFDAGVTPTGRPFFVMELVDGLPLTRFADEHRLTVPQRLELFREVCRAVSHAHQKGIIHRDLKPSNVLVSDVDGEATPKVIDFGIAKAIRDDDEPAADLTQHGLFLGTPQYMSPEQAGKDELDVDVRTDVFSLGVLLYELLTGTTPLDSKELGDVGLAGMQRLLHAAVTPRPSRRLRDQETAGAIAAARRSDAAHLTRLLAQDLDWVVMKALEPERGRRYASAWEFAEDVRRVLEHEPVFAGPPGRTYRMRKFVRRNRLAVGAAAAVVVALLVAVVGTTAGYVEANAARESLEATNARLKRMVTFQRERLSRIDLQGMGTTLRGALLQRTRRGLVAAGWSDEEEVSRKLDSLDRSLANTGFTSVAGDVISENLLDPAEQAIDREFADQPADRAALLQSLAATMSELGLLARGLKTGQRALALRRETLGDANRETLDSVSLVASLLRRLHRLEEAERLMEEAAQGWRHLYGADDPLTLAGLVDLARLRADQGEWERAEGLFTDALERAERILGPADLTTLNAVNNYAGFLEGRGRIEEAARRYRRALDGLRTLPGGAGDAVQAASNLSRMLVVLGHLDEAEVMSREALTELRRTLGDDHPTTLEAMNALAGVLFRNGDREGARELLRVALTGLTRTLGAAHPHRLQALCNVGTVLVTDGRLVEGEEVIAEAVARGREVFPPDDPMFGGILIRHGVVLMGLERIDEAEAALLEGRRIRATVPGDARRMLDEAAQALILLYTERDRLEPDAGHGEEVARWRAALAGETSEEAR